MTYRIFLHRHRLSLAGFISGPIHVRQDDETCRSYGAKPGTDVYVRCRMAVEGNRSSRRMAYAQSQMADQYFMNSMRPNRL